MKLNYETVRPELDRTTSHSTKLSENDSQVAGYVEGSHHGSTSSPRTDLTGY